MNLLFFIRNIRKEYILLGILALLIPVTLIMVFLGKPTEKIPLPIIKQETTPAPSSTQPTVPIKGEYNPSIVVGKTTEKEVKLLPNIKSRTTLLDDKIQYTFESPLKNRDNTIITTNNLVGFKRSITELSGPKLPLLSDFRKKYGDPEKEIQGSRYYGRYETTYIYAARGLALIANPYSDEVYEIHTFVPISSDQYLKLWGEDIMNYTDNPPSP